MQFFWNKCTLFIINAGKISQLCCSDPDALYQYFQEWANMIWNVYHSSILLLQPQEMYKIWNLCKIVTDTLKPILSGHPKRRPKIGFQDQLSLTAGQKYCRMLQASILQYFWPSLSYHLSLRPLFCLFLSGCLKQVLLYHLSLTKCLSVISGWRCCIQLWYF